MKTVGFDIDNTMTNSFEVANSIYLASEFYDGKTDFRNMSEIVRDKFYSKYLVKCFGDAVLKSGVKEVFDYLNKMNHRIVIITRRGYGLTFDVEDVTNKFLEKEDLKFDAIYFNIDDKGSVCKKENVDIFFDDHVFNLESVQNVGIKAVMFKKHEEDDRFEVVTNWDELLIVLKKEGF